jgi:hypothetical protein
MIRFFPMPYPDESLISVFARYNKLTGNNNINNTFTELTGNKVYQITPNYIPKLNFLYRQLPNNTIYNENYFIEKHTVLPIYKSFVQEERYENAIKNIMLSDKSETYPLHSLGYISLSKVNGIFYCPNCITEDRKMYGEAYTHRSHQVDGNFICWKHKSLLRIYPYSKSKRFDYNIDKINTDLFKNFNTNLYKNSSGKFYNELLVLSNSIDKIFYRYDNLPTHTIVREKYFSKLNDKGYFLKSGVINQVKLHDDFIIKYSKDFLIFLNSFPEVRKISWLRKVLLKITTTRSYHPIKHLLLINFLFDDIDDFLNYQAKNHNEFIKCKNKIDNKTKMNYNSKKEYHQNILIKLIEKEPQLARSQIDKIIPYTYRWLMRNEKDWLEVVLPKPCYAHLNSFDWLKRDIEMYIELLFAINNILENNIPVKISVHTLNKHIKYDLSKKNLEKMPITKTLIEKYSESYSEFRNRRLELYLYESLGQSHNKHISIS